MRLVRAGILAATGFAALFAGCAHELSPPAQTAVAVPVYSRSKKLQIRMVNEIAATTDTLYRKKGLGTLRELLIGKEILRLERPFSVHVDRQERIFVSDPDSHLVHFFDVPGERYLAIRGESARELVSPLCLASDDNDHLFITDSASGKVYRYSIPEGRLEPFSKASLARPTGIAYDPFLQRLFVVDTLSHQVVVLGNSGEELYRIGRRGEGKGEFNFPTDITIDITGRVLVNDTLNSRIQVFAPDGRYLLSFGAPGNAAGSFLRAKGIATDSLGSIYVSDAITDMVQIFDFGGRYIASFGRSGSERGEFWMPHGLFIDQEDRLYAVDTYNKRVQIFEGLTYDPQEKGGRTP